MVNKIHEANQPKKTSNIGDSSKLNSLKRKSSSLKGQPNYIHEGPSLIYEQQIWLQNCLSSSLDVMQEIDILQDDAIRMKAAIFGLRQSLQLITRKSMTHSYDPMDREHIHFMEEFKNDRDHAHKWTLETYKQLSANQNLLNIITTSPASDYVKELSFLVKNVKELSEKILANYKDLRENREMRETIYSTLLQRLKCKLTVLPRESLSPSEISIESNAD